MYRFLCLKDKGYPPEAITRNEDTPKRDLSDLMDKVTCFPKVAGSIPIARSRTISPILALSAFEEFLVRD